MKYISTVIKVSKAEIYEELTKRSSYTALSVSPIGGEIGAGWSDRIILSKDDYPWCSNKLSMAFNKITQIISPHLKADDIAIYEDEKSYTFKVELRSENYNITDSISNYIKEGLINYTLAEWFIERVPDKYSYLMMQYENMIGLLHTTLNKMYMPVRRKTNYF